jgi:hypothetical protein
LVLGFAELHAPHANSDYGMYIHYIIYTYMYVILYVIYIVYPITFTEFLKPKKLRLSGGTATAKSGNIEEPGLSLGTIQRGDFFCLVNFCKFF